MDHKGIGEDGEA